MHMHGCEAAEEQLKLAEGPHVHMQQCTHEPADFNPAERTKRKQRI
jgi:hypothetical protein